ncbi:hypothetical protein [Gluconobacter thailandicus]|uniref:hypothetical protein n=1 Tax=Gluconobacter thailandicus TaxID=257438 RepID=UPI0014303E82|nr:hypothetical protein [Gluconobacter thailandicus]
MTLPWSLNPWAVVRRLRGELKWRDHMRLDMARAWRDERRKVSALKQLVRGE